MLRTCLQGQWAQLVGTWEGIPPPDHSGPGFRMTAHASAALAASVDFTASLMFRSRVDVQG